MSGPRCEFCPNAAVFVIRQMESGEPRERHLCAKHALNVDLPPGTYILDNRAYPSFADLVAAVGKAADEPSLTPSH